MAGIPPLKSTTQYWAATTAATAAAMRVEVNANGGPCVYLKGFLPYGWAELHLRGMGCSYQRHAS